jgi:putative SOS response-associated peptidase YedK
MCGRIAQTRSVYYYAKKMGWLDDAPIALPEEPVAHFNGSPGAKHWLFLAGADGIPTATQAKWQWRSRWAAENKKPPQINAVIEKLEGVPPAVRITSDS